uniref:Putative inorganic phosphate cotransporter n=1 Tax=Clastoptera arizonana TaxID=38151 RepID=A0A1B6CNP3_9HEMI
MMENYGSIRNRSINSPEDINSINEVNRIEIANDSQSLIPNHSQKTGYGTRHTQALLLFLGLVVAYGLRINLSVAIVAMTNNSTNPDFPHLDWDTKTKGTILSSFFWGYLITQIPAGNLSRIYGPRLILFGGLLISGLATMLSPLIAVKGDWIFFCASRVCQGMFQGVIYPSLNTHMAKWIPPLERGRLISFIYSGSQMGTVVTLFLTGHLAAGPWGWPGIFYATGAAAIVWAVVWFFIGADLPETHPYISQEEKFYIKSSLISSSSDSNLMATPWKDILKSGPMWALFLCHCGQNWGYWTFLTEMPSYLSHALGFDIKMDGVLSALPYLSMFVLTNILSWVGDYISSLNIVSKNFQRKMWNSIAHVGGALALVILGIYGTSVELAILLLTISVALNGCVYMGFLCNHIDLSPNFAGVLVGITNGCANISSIIGPLVAGFILKDESNIEQWNIVFFLSALIFFLGNLIFIIFGSTDVQYWNEPKSNNKQGIDNYSCTN